MLIEKLKNGVAYVALGAALALPTACAPGADNQGKKAPESLRDVEIPPDFTFATSRPVALTISAEASVLGGQAGALEIARPDGRVLYRGPLTAENTLALNLVVPTKDEEVQLKLQANQQEHVATVRVVDGAATQVFR